MTTPKLRETFTAKGDIDPDLEHMWAAESGAVFEIGKPVALTDAPEPSHLARHAKHRFKRHVHRHRAHRPGHRRIRSAATS
jgi:hypothetical protein